MSNTGTEWQLQSQVKFVESSATATFLRDKLYIVSTSLQIIVNQLLTNIMLKLSFYL